MRKRIALAAAGLAIVGSGLTVTPAQAMATAWGTKIWSSHKHCYAGGHDYNFQIQYQRDSAAGAIRATGEALYVSGVSLYNLDWYAINTWGGGDKLVLYPVGPPYTGFGDTVAVNYTNPAANARLLATASLRSPSTESCSQSWFVGTDGFVA